MENKEEFYKLFSKTTKKNEKTFNKVIVDFVNNSKDEEVQRIKSMIESLTNTQLYLEKLPDEIAKPPYTIDSAIQVLNIKLVQKFVDTLS